VYEDLNGNGREDFVALIVLFEKREVIGADGTVRFFDFDRKNRGNFNDVTRMFDLIWTARPKLFFQREGFPEILRPRKRVGPFLRVKFFPLTAVLHKSVLNPPV